MEKEGAQHPGCVPSCLILRNAKVFCCHMRRQQKETFKKGNYN